MSEAQNCATLLYVLKEMAIDWYAVYKTAQNLNHWHRVCLISCATLLVHSTAWCTRCVHWALPALNSSLA